MDETKFDKIELRDAKGNLYTLQFNKRTVLMMERNGFKIDLDHPYAMIHDLFRGAFRMHHKGMTAEQIDAIWDQQTHKEELLPALITLYNAPMEVLMKDAETEDENPTWRTV